ncbi:MAG: terminase large subunit domain-containing protein [Sphingobacteriales bacterium]|jgi:hypothetical protein
MIASDLARALDPALIAEAAGITPDAWQAELLRSTADRVLMLCARQCGKTTTAAFIALSTAIYQKPGGLIIIVSPSQRQSGEIFRTVMQHHSRLEGVPELLSLPCGLRWRTVRASLHRSAPSAPSAVMPPLI